MKHLRRDYAFEAIQWMRENKDKAISLTYEAIAETITAELGFDIRRGQVAGLYRDLVAGGHLPPKQQPRPVLPQQLEFPEHISRAEMDAVHRELTVYALALHTIDEVAATMCEKLEPLAVELKQQQDATRGQDIMLKGISTRLEALTTVVKGLSDRVSSVEAFCERQKLVNGRIIGNANDTAKTEIRTEGGGGQ